MEKSALIHQISYAFVPERSRMISHDVGGMQITPHTEGSLLIRGAQTLEGALTESLGRLPDTLADAHRGDVREAILDFFGGVMVEVEDAAVASMVESQAQACLRKLETLLPEGI